MRQYFIFFCILFFMSGCSSNSINERFEVVYTINSRSSFQLEGETRQQVTIAVVPKLINISYFNAVRDGALEAGRDLGVDIIYKGPLLADVNQQMEIVKEFIDLKVDVIAVSANDPIGLAPILLKAKEEGIHVITWDSDTVTEARDFFVNMVEPETLGRHLMNTLAWNTEEDGEFAILTGSLSASNLNEWLHWIKVQNQEFYPNMKLVEVVATDDDPTKAYILSKDLLTLYPNLKGIIGNTSVGPPSAAQAVKELDKVGEISVVGLSPPNQMNEHLKDGSAQIVTLWSPKKLGYLTVALAKNIQMGVSPFDGQEIPKVGKIRVIDDMIIMEQPIDFTKENVDQYDF
ncbi:MAG: autoinducer 2 ABC transporter substrate-binding protein [Anaerobacillus sp.]|uniref:autoinducer 2 ABC transporter substrate-binding protein n=1 Tax=Anaerobacillus sp. TaxID=1872506 RepID=UPI00391CAE56